MEKMARGMTVQGVLSDDDIAKELARLRDRNLAAELASQRVAVRTRKENLVCRKRYEKSYRERLHREIQNSLAHLKVFGNMYDSSPFRHDIVKNREKYQLKKRAEARQDAIFQATTDRLAAMTGQREDYIARHVEPGVVARATNTLLKTEVLRFRHTELDRLVLLDELTQLGGMVSSELDVSLDAFPVLEQKLGRQGRVRDTVPLADAVDYAAAYLAGSPLKPGSPKPMYLRAANNADNADNDDGGEMRREANTYMGNDTSASRSRPHSSGARTQSTTPTSRPDSGGGTGSRPRSGAGAGARAADARTPPSGSRAATGTGTGTATGTSLSSGKSAHRPVLAGSGIIMLVGADGMHHASHGHYDELEGRTDHHHHLAPGEEKWNAVKQHASTTARFAHNVIGAKIA